MRTVSFITANYAARALNYGGNTNWGENDRATSAWSTPDNFRAMAQEIKNAGFADIDLWTAHCHWQRHSRDYMQQVKTICAQLDLEITSYAGGLSITGPADLDAPFLFMSQLGVPMFAGGIGGVPDADLAAMVNEMCQKYGLEWAFENHPQKSVEEIMAKIGGGKYPRCGVALDTGHCGTQGLDALEAVKGVRESLLIVHLKDVKAAGAHVSCALGDGIVPVEGVVRYLVESDWHGTICIEHEPFDRDPMPEVVTSLQRVRGWLGE